MKKDAQPNAAKKRRWTEAGRQCLRHGERMTIVFLAIKTRPCTPHQ
jgi:hypothetical protein